MDNEKHLAEKQGVFLTDIASVLTRGAGIGALLVQAPLTPDKRMISHSQLFVKSLGSRDRKQLHLNRPSPADQSYPLYARRYTVPTTPKGYAQPVAGRW